jgi:hypothetical protein
MADSPSLPVPLSPLVQRYLDGESIQTLAAEHQTCHRTIYKWLLKECGPQYEEIVTDALIARIADADQSLDMARDGVQIARAREMAKFARMDFERRRPKLYGPKQEVQVDHTVNITVNRGPVILPVVSDPQIISVHSEVIDKREEKG